MMAFMVSNPTSSVHGKGLSLCQSKDQAVGTRFAEHVMGGYKFLIRYYTRDDDI